MAKLKTHKKGDSGNKKMKKNSKNSGPSAVAMKKKAESKPNPFETIWSRRKFDVLGKKRKGEEVRIGLSRALAIDKRKMTLLKEYEQSNKASIFIDKRIGERNDNLGEFDKAILRAQRVQQRQGQALKVNKKEKFNLPDGDEEDDGFEGDGAFLSEIDDFKEDELFEEDNGADERNSSIIKKLNSQNIDPFEKASLANGEKNKQKSKKEVMDEIILKSKYFKAQKAKDKEENEELMEKLDNDFTSLLQSQALISLTKPITPSTEDLKQDMPDTYDKMVKQMGLESRARPSERTKAPEEIAQDERERLESLEEKCQKRMIAADDSSDEESVAHKDVKASTQRPRSTSGDDLGDSFSFDEDQGTNKGWVDGILESQDATDLESEEDDADSESDDEEDNDDDVEEEGSGEDNNAIDNAVLVKDWEQSDDDNDDTDLEGDDDEMEQEDHKKETDSNVLTSKKRKIGPSDAKNGEAAAKHPAVRQDSIPFVIEAPSSMEELSALLENCSNDDIIAAIHRIRICNAISLKAGNRKKIQVFYGVLLQYFAVSANKKPLNLEMLNMVVKPLMEISAEIPYFAAICARQRIQRARVQLSEAIKNQDKSCWPSMKMLSLLRLWSMVFPCSDFRHVVMTPAILLMCEYLMRCPILCERDMAIGSFLCSLVLSVAKQSQKFCPEAIMFIRTLLMAAANRNQVLSLESQFFYPMKLKAVSSLLCIRAPVNGITPLNLFTTIDMPDDFSCLSSDDFRASVLMSLVETLQGFVNIYERLNSYPELFLPMSKLLLEVADQEYMPLEIHDKLKDVSQGIMNKVHNHLMMRQPLQMRKQKPVPIKLLNPKFEENFVKGRDYDPDRERADRKKLKKLVKQENKGAIRELRKDNYFMFEAKQKSKALQEEERAEKYGKEKAFMQEQEHNFKSGQLGKGKKRRR